VRDIITAVEKHSGHKVPTREEGRRTGDPERLVASAERASRTLGWRPVHDLDSIVATAWAWEIRKLKTTPSMLNKKER
jgi:UDP-glucose 4-epimerase